MQKYYKNDRRNVYDGQAERKRDRERGGRGERKGKMYISKDVSEKENKSA